MDTKTYKVTNTGNYEVALANDGEYGYLLPCKFLYLFYSPLLIQNSLNQTVH